ncbi:MAG: VWA domain-containing protein [Candidatus Adiutrix sp.]|jgi:hypothetical protein|nr:VWA domain-containing protein [Candidatus Adiutrix sp.]
MPPKFLAFFFVLLLSGPAAQAQDFAVKDIDCGQWPEVRLTVQLPEAQETADHYTLSLPAEGQPLKAASLEGPKDPIEPLSIVVALDTSPSLSRADFAAAKEALGDYAAQLESGERLALLGFNDHVQAVTGFTADQAVIANSLKGLSLAGSKTELYKAMRFGVDLLKDAPGRRLLLVVSDGWDEGREVTSWQVLKAAQEHKVQINAIGLPGKSPDSDNHLAILENLAKDTGGLYRKAGSPASLSLAVYDLLKAQRQTRPNGYQYELKFILPPTGPGAEPDIKATLTRQIGANGQTLSLTLTPPRAADTPPATPDAAAPEPEDIPWWQQPWAWGSAAVAVVLLIILVVILTRRKSAARAARNQATVALNITPNRHTVAVQSPRQSSPFILELTELGLRFSLSPGTATLGAGPGNDFQVDIPTVSGKHAEFQVTTTECRVKDLNSTNGTQVNGRNISQWTILKNGDWLTFGTARAMLRLNR